MKRLIKSVFIFLLIIIVIEFSSFLYNSGYTSNFVDYLKKAYASLVDIPINIEEYPVIKSISNSSSEKLTNDNVVILIEAEDNSNIINFYYSFDKENWNTDFNFMQLGKKASAKLVFNSNINKTIYFYVLNEKLNKSYIFSTVVIIDKEVPRVSYEVGYNDNLKQISVKSIDDYEMKKLQYSYDEKKWYSNFQYKYYSLNKKLDGRLDVLLGQRVYIRAVDKVGNISKTYIIN